MTRIPQKALLLALAVLAATAHGPGPEDDAFADGGWIAVLEPCHLFPAVGEPSTVADASPDCEVAPSDQWESCPRAPRAPPV